MEVQTFSNRQVKTLDYWLLVIPYYRDEVEPGNWDVVTECVRTARKLYAEQGKEANFRVVQPYNGYDQLIWIQDHWVQRPLGV